MIYVIIYPFWDYKSIYVINSSPHEAAYMRQWTEPSLVQVMSCRLSGAKPWYNQCWLIVNWNKKEQIGTNFIETWIRILSFSFKKMHLKMSSAKMAAILSKGRWVIMPPGLSYIPRIVHTDRDLLCLSWCGTHRYPLSLLHWYIK